MRVTVVHGYFLGDSGSGVYARNLSRSLAAAGHDVTLVCQEREPGCYDFIDEAYTLDPTNTTLRREPLARPDRGGRSRCRLVRPDLGGRLLVYVDGPFAGFERSGIKAFQDAPTEWIDRYAEANTAALRAVFAEWPPDVVLAQHALMQPYLVRLALGGSAPYVVTTHGSELNFSLKLDPRLVPYGIDGLADARAVIAVSPTSALDVTDWAASHHLDIAEKTVVVAPGIDMDLFAPSPSRADAISDLTHHVALPDDFDLTADDDVLAFVGRVGWSKGIQHAVAALSIISATRPGAKLLVAGAGPARDSLVHLASLLTAGDATAARELAETDAELRTENDYGPVVTEGAVALGPARVAYLGHLTSDDVARLFRATDLALAPSIFPEAAALVTSEALAAGALPIVAYQSGLQMLADIEADELADATFCDLIPGSPLSAGIAAAALRHLERYPTKDPDFRGKLHAIALTHFLSWGDVARRHIELGTGAVTQ